jgi:hypothetical protein
MYDWSADDALITLMLNLRPDRSVMSELRELQRAILVR